ncbi:DMT family transporter [Streptomyces qaidamensis]|uniref:DMT family transporter n=1 Tax=Streptomyces qaidamensis TaxID=1783515 RepID=UPI0007C67D4F|nr:DMT family transporter [Streptomyces qaidamensis]
MLTVVLALLAALCNASASVLQRRAAADGTEGATGAREALRWLGQALRQPYWVAGAVLLALTTVLQAAALRLGSLALVQPLMAAELLFTLVVGSVIFRRRPDTGTCLAFVALAAGLALFLTAAAPAAGRSTAYPERWLPAAVGVLGVVLGLTVAARPLRGASRAALLGLASAVCFAATAALLKETTDRLRHGVGALLAAWPAYATVAAGVVAFLLLQGALRAGTLAASQPALTLGDALTSVTLGWVLFGERIALGARVVPELIGVVLMGAGSVGLARTLANTGTWDTRTEVRGVPTRTSEERRESRPEIDGPAWSDGHDSDEGRHGP